MTTQERINELTRAALRSGPPEPSIPKPAVFRPSYENELHATLAPAVQQPAPVAQAAQVAQAVIPAAQVVAEPVAVVEEEPAFKDEPNAEFQAMIEAREQKIKTKRSRQSLVLTLLCLTALGSFGTWCVVSPTAKTKIAALKTAYEESKRDVKTLGSITKQYDKSLEKIAGHGDQISEATKAMGVNPAAADDGKDPGFEDEMRKFGGDNSRTTADRNRDLQSKFGAIQKLAQQNGIAPTPHTTNTPAQNTGEAAKP
ncbi:MAG: hypothetical protein QM755_17680 [Luteolibacter sp.]